MRLLFIPHGNEPQRHEKKNVDRSLFAGDFHSFYGELKKKKMKKKLYISIYVCSVEFAKGSSFHFHTVPKM